MIVVIGAGITGLAAAYELTQRGAPFVVLEASPRAGGLILTEQVDGFTIDGGPDSVLVQKPGAIQLCNELGLGSKMIATRSPRTAFVLRDGQLFPLPTPSVLGIPTTWSGMAGFDLLPPAARARLALEPTIPSARMDDDESVASFFRRRFGEATVDLIAQPLVGGIHSGDVESLSMRSLFPRLVEAEARHGSVINAFRQSRTDVSEGLFRSLPAGMGELVTAIERRMPVRSIRLRTPVTSIAPAEGRWRVSAGEEIFTASAVILTTPSYVTADLVAPFDPHAAQLCRETRYVSTASVVLAWPRGSIPHPLAGSGFVVARSHSDRRITACTWVSSKWTGRAPEGSALFRAFLGGVHDPQVAALEDETLTAIAVRDLSAVLGVSDAPSLARIYRWPNSSAQYNVGHLKRVATLEARLSAHPGLLLAGSGFKSIGIPDCVTDGRAAAAQAVRFE